MFITRDAGKTIGSEFNVQTEWFVTDSNIDRIEVSILQVMVGKLSKHI